MPPATLGFAAPTGSQRTRVETTVENSLSLVTSLSSRSRYFAVGQLTDRLRQVQLEIVEERSPSAQPEEGGGAPAAGEASRKRRRGHTRSRSATFAVHSLFDCPRVPLTLPSRCPSDSLWLACGGVACACVLGGLAWFFPFLFFSFSLE